MCTLFLNVVISKDSYTWVCWGISSTLQAQESLFVDISC